MYVPATRRRMERMDVEEPTLPSAAGGDGDPAEETVVPLAEVASYGVIVQLPMICVNCDDRGDDRAVKNFRVIPYERLERLMNEAKHIETASYADQLGISERFVKDMVGSNKHSRDTEQMLKCITMFGDVGRSIDVDDTFVDASTEGITFDPIRKYENDRTGVLVRHTHTTWRGRSFYSQFGDDVALMARVRRKMNETDLNQMHYMLECFEKSLLFHKTRLYNNTVKVTNLCLFYLSLIDNSLPVENMCDTDLKNNFLGTLIDVVVRSRVITKWRLNHCSRNLIQDMVRNYDGKNHMVAMCRLETPRERADYILRTLSETHETRKAIAGLSYGEYEKVLEESAYTINGDRYYVFKSKFVHGIVATQGFAALNTYTAESDDIGHEQAHSYLFKGQ